MRFFFYHILWPIENGKHINDYCPPVGLSVSWRDAFFAKIRVMSRAVDPCIVFVLHRSKGSVGTMVKWVMTLVN